MQDPQLKKIQKCWEENRRWQRSADEKFAHIQVQFDRLFDGQDRIIATLERIEQECFLMNHAITRNETEIKALKTADGALEARVTVCERQIGI